MSGRESTFLLPTLIGLLGAVGLTAALFGDGWWDVLAWLGLGIPAVLGLWPLRPATLRSGPLHAGAYQSRLQQQPAPQPRNGPE